jgi:hypothetical protein
MGASHVNVKIIGTAQSGRTRLYNTFRHYNYHNPKLDRQTVRVEEALGDECIEAIANQNTSLIYVTKAAKLAVASTELMWIVERMEPYPKRQLLILITHADQHRDWPHICTRAPTPEQFAPAFAATLQFMQEKLGSRVHTAWCSLQFPAAELPGAADIEEAVDGDEGRPGDNPFMTDYDWINKNNALRAAAQKRAERIDTMGLSAAKGWFYTQLSKI